MRTHVEWLRIPALLYLVGLMGGLIIPGRPVLAAPTHAPTQHVVLVDPGHGGDDPGTIGVTGDKEKDITLAVGRRLAECLRRQGLRTAMTRSADRTVDLEARPALANRLHAALLVSIHANSNPDHGIHGFTVYVAPHASLRSRTIARAEVGALKAAGFASRGIQECPYRVLVDSRGPATLIELGFLSNPPENARLCDPREQDRYARAISRGIIEGLSR